MPTGGRHVRCPSCTPMTRNACRRCHGSGRIIEPDTPRHMRAGGNGCVIAVVAGAVGLLEVVRRLVEVVS